MEGIFFGLRLSIPGFFFGRIIWQVFKGWLDSSRDFLGGIQNNLKIRGGAAYPGCVQSVCE